MLGRTQVSGTSEDPEEGEEVHGGTCTRSLHPTLCMPTLHPPPGERLKHEQGQGLAFWLPQYLANFFLWDSPQEGKELHVLSPSQQLGDGIKLRAVAHVLMYFVDVG